MARRRIEAIKKIKIVRIRERPSGGGLLEKSAWRLCFTMRTIEKSADLVRFAGRKNRVYSSISLKQYLRSMYEPGNY
jgi:hypothetical protein